MLSIAKATGEGAGIWVRQAGRSNGPNTGLRPRPYENSANAQSPGSSNPSRDANRRSWADLEGRLCARPREVRVFTRHRPAAAPHELLLPRSLPSWDSAHSNRESAAFACWLQHLLSGQVQRTVASDLAARTFLRQHRRNFPILIN